MKYVAILIAAAFFMLFFTRRRMFQRQKKRVMISSPSQAVGIQPREMYDQLNSLMAELATLSRQINGELDTRCAKLGVLLRQVDEKIARYEQLRQENSPSPSITSVPNNIIEEPNLGEENEETLQILNLAGKGMSPVAIAKSLDRPVGEIQLILSLNRGKEPKSKNL
jgi:hypothetical protein